MKRSLTWYLAWGSWLLTVAMVVGTIVLEQRRTGDDLLTVLEVTDTGVLILVGMVFASFAGALLASRLPRNFIGWFFCGLAISLTADVFVNEYMQAFDPGDAPLRIPIAAINTLFGEPFAVVVVTLPLLLFPTGALPSPRWRPLLWLIIGLISIAAVDALFAAELIQDSTDVSIDNPLRIDALASVLDALAPVTGVLTVVAALLSVASLVLRFRRARGIERQQIKWFAYCGVLAIVSIVVAAIVELIQFPGCERVGDVFIYFGLLVNLSVVMPIAIAIAILRYRLYDIDRIINRTVVYGLLSLGLLLTYLSIVVVMGEAVRALTGETSQLVVAASTLVVAALFQPARRRVQQLVDRRFYRRKYDAARTLDAFNARLRDQVDLPELSTELQRVVSETMQPAHVSLWLRGLYSRTRSREG